jgi:hypothetical protein
MNAGIADAIVILVTPADAAPKRWRGRLFSRARTIALCGAACLSYLIAAAISAQAFQLVTDEEAALPPGKISELDLRGPTRRPNITIVWPSPDAGVMHSPLDLKLRFRAFGGAKIDPNSVVVTYVKQPAIDITQRIRTFIGAAGIDVSQAEIPPGSHQFWVEVMDSEGRINGIAFNVRIAK